LKIKIKLIPSVLKDDLIEEKILEWVKSTSNKIDQVIEYSSLVIKDHAHANLRELFTDKNWKRYVDVLTKCDPPNA
jgi:hypothetical protein